MEIVGIGLAAVIGITLGLLGGGGSILTVPIFVYLLGYGVKEAVAMSLAVVGVASGVGALGHWREGNVDLRMAGVFGGVAMIGTYLGARLSIFLSGPAQLAIFAFVMLIAALFMFRERVPAPIVERQATDLTRSTLPLLLVVAEGLGVGVLTGLVGVGGGFLIVPALVLIGQLPMKRAIGTSLLIIAMKSGAGFYGYLGQVVLDWQFVALFTIVAVGGIVAGTYLVRFVSQPHLQRAFAIFLLIMGALILFENRSVLLAERGGDRVGTIVARHPEPVKP